MNELQIEEKYADKWKWVGKTEQELKKIAMDIYNGLIYTDRHCRQSDIMSVFMCLLFMDPRSKPTSTDTPTDRDNKIYELLERDIESKHYLEFIKNIGLVYEYLSEAGPRCINGCPTFTSVRLLSREDTIKMFEFHDKYKELRETTDKF